MSDFTVTLTLCPLVVVTNAMRFFSSGAGSNRTVAMLSNGTLIVASPSVPYSITSPL